MENEPETYPMDEALITMLAEIRTQMASLNAQYQGALVLFIRQQKLPGTWQVAENGRELVRQSERAPAATGGQP